VKCWWTFWGERAFCIFHTLKATAAVDILRCHSYFWTSSYSYGKTTLHYKSLITVTVVGEVFVDILRRTCFLYLSYIKGNGRCGHFAMSFVFLNFFIFPTVKLRYIIRGDFIIPGGDFFLHGGDFVLPGANDTTALGDSVPAEYYFRLRICWCHCLQ